LFIQVALHVKNNKDNWYIDSGFSSHLIGDRTKFITLKKNEGSVTFGDNGSSKIVRKVTLNLYNGRDKVEKVLCVEKLKHNLLNVRKMCDQGHTLTFDFLECENKKSNSGKLAAKLIRTPNNVYTLD
jgi:hypothetical protein